MGAKIETTSKVNWSDRSKDTVEVWVEFNEAVTGGPVDLTRSSDEVLQRVINVINKELSERGLRSLKVAQWWEGLLAGEAVHYPPFHEAAWRATLIDMASRDLLKRERK